MDTKWIQPPKPIEEFKGNDGLTEEEADFFRSIASDWAYAFHMGDEEVSSKFRSFCHPAHYGACGSETISSCKESYRRDVKILRDKGYEGYIPPFKAYGGR